MVTNRWYREQRRADQDATRSLTILKQRKISCIIKVGPPVRRETDGAARGHVVMIRFNKKHPHCNNYTAGCPHSQTSESDNQLEVSICLFSTRSWQSSFSPAVSYSRAVNLGIRGRGSLAGVIFIMSAAQADSAHGSGRQVELERELEQIQREMTELEREREERCRRIMDRRVQQVTTLQEQIGRAHV